MILFYDGFDAAHTAIDQVLTTYLTRRGYSGTLNGTTKTGRNGSGMSAYNCKPVIAVAAGSSFVLGVGYKVDALSTAQILALKTSTNYQLTLHIDATGGVSLRRGGTSGTVLASAPAGTVAVSVWNYFELKTTINATTGSYEVRMNGATLFSGSGANTQAQAGSTADNVEVGQNNTSAYIDDFYVADTTGSTPWNDFLGPVQAVVLLPTADGASTGWTHSTGTTQFGCIDEVPANDDTDYVSAASTGLTDLCSCQTVGSSDTVLAVNQLVLARKTDAGVAQLTPTLRIGTTNYDGTTQAIPDSYQYISSLRQVSPATSAQWTATEVNGAQLVGFTSA